MLSSICYIKYTRVLTGELDLQYLQRERGKEQKKYLLFPSFFLEHAGTLHCSEAKALKLAEKNINCSNKTHRVWHGSMVFP